jgi:pimeloyl-ACP methyl ester carboxylesterase
MAETPHFRGGEGEPLVLIHGFSGTWPIWQPVLPALTARHDVLAATLPGHHGGPRFDDGVQVSVEAITDTVERQLDEAGFETAHLVGNSLGGWIALDLARRGRARSVVGLAPAGGWTAGTRHEKRLKTLFVRLHRMTSLGEPFIDTIARRPGLRKLAFRDICRHGERLTPDAAAASMRGLLGCEVYFDLMDAVTRDGPPRWLGEVRAPVLVAWAEHDRILKEKGYSEGLRAIPGVQWTTLPGCGHVPMGDDPELVARTILDFTSAAGTAGDPSAPARRSAPAGSST